MLKDLLVLIVAINLVSISNGSDHLSATERLKQLTARAEIQTKHLHQVNQKLTAKQANVALRTNQPVRPTNFLAPSPTLS